MRAPPRPDTANNATYIDRPPRIQPEIPFGEFPIPPPPDKQEDGIARLLQIGLPMVSIFGFALTSAFGGSGRNPLLLLPMGLAVIASVLYSLYSYRREKRRRADIEQAYADRLIELTREMHNYHDTQRRAFYYNYPDPTALLRIVETSKRPAPANGDSPAPGLRADARLWERRVTDADFGVVRLGIGTLPSTVTYTLAEADNFEDHQVRDAMKLDADSRYVSEIPAILSFRNPATAKAATKAAPQAGEEEAAPAGEPEAYQPPATHALGIVGERDAAHEFVRALLAHYVVFHTPMDARLYILAGQAAAWSWAAPLPHSQGDVHTRFQCFLDQISSSVPDDAFDEGDDLEQFLEGVRKVLAQRKIQLQEHDENEERGDPTLPLLLVVVDLLDGAADNPRLNDIEADPAISILLEEGSALGAAVIFLVPERGKVPSGCRSVIEIEKTAPTAIPGGEPAPTPYFRYAETGLNTARLVGVADVLTSVPALETLARQLSALNVRQGLGANLAPAVSFLDLMGYRSIEELRKASRQKWQDSVQPRKANWLRVRLGYMSGNKPRTLVLSAKRDGVHGMVAGSTGSGKSELLISLVIGLAATYDPTVLNFVLVDYKGGSAFNEFKELPHCVDVITNLGADSVSRMFTAIRAELERRQQLNTRTGTKNIVEYRQEGHHQTHAPYPYLFIIIDEFAEMIADRAEFKTELETITRVGRAQGVSLILAAQRPSGVTDQMRSNIKFRICLRVESPGESREMLRRSDAAFLPATIPGRGYLQVANEDIELIQLAYTGERYRDPSEAPRATVIWPERGGSVAAMQDQEPPELYKVIIALLKELAAQHGTRKQRAPWPNFLPRQLWLSRALVTKDPQADAITSEEYLDPQAIAQVMLGQPAGPTVYLNPAIPQWLNGQPGWLDHLDWQQYAVRPVVGLIDNPYGAKQLPLIVDFPRGHVVIFGASGWGKTSFLSAVIAALAATHSPAQFHAYILDLGGRNLGTLEKLPHVGALIIPDEEGYEERTEQLLREINGIIEQRRTLLNNAQLTDIYDYNQAHPDAVQPAILVAVDNFIEFAETFGGDSSETETVLDKFIALVRQAKPCGVHFAISVSRPGDLSNQLYSLFTERFTLKLADPTEYRSVVGDQVPEIPDIPGRGYTKVDGRPLTFQVAAVGEPGHELEQLQKLVESINQHGPPVGPQAGPVRVDALPKAVLFKQLLARQHKIPLDAEFLAHLQGETQDAWAASRASAHADWLKVTIGVISGDRPRLLQFEAKKDGVHGMIAGGTGAGKSELLMTLIVGLALNYDPSILNFVLVDYKGGGAFQPFTELPHCVDMITNLNKSAVRRVFTSISAEMQRRQKLNAETGTKDIVEYRARGLHLTHAPYPHLFIIIDEYAEMITANPEFRDDLDSITRLGRAQGVNLLLASQRPVGVSDQMRANIKYRICLRVEGVDTSREMLRRPDAAFLPSGLPGRGYLQIGNENIELMQVAYTGEKYEYTEVAEGAEQPRFYDVIVRLANDLLQGERPRTPWPPFLPTALTFAHPLQPDYLDPAYRPLITLDRTERLTVNPFVEDWLADRGRWVPTDWNKTALRAIVGLLDDPYQARQLPLVVDFTKGHAILFGASGWGKTSFLRSLIVSLASRHASDEFQAHVLDLGGRNLEVLGELPHVGTVILPDEPGYEERVQQLWRELNDVVDARKKLFSDAGVSTLTEYNSGQAQRLDPALLPAILVAIDNFAEYIESFGDLNKQNDPGNLLEAFVALARQGKAYGLHFVITTNRLNVISSKIYSLFTERLTLRLADASEYSAIVGGQIGDIEEIAGRGYTRVGRAALAFQVALLPGAVDAQGQVAGGEATIVRALGAKMRQALAARNRPYTPPLRVEPLPTNSSYRQVLAELLHIDLDEATFLKDLRARMAQRWQANATAEGADWLQATLGVASGNRLRTFHFEARRDGAHGMIAGGTGSGKSELLMTLIVALAVNYPPSILNFVLVDYKGGGTFRPFEKLPHCVDNVTNLNKAAVDRMFTAINAEIRRRQKLNADTATSDIIAYRRKGLHLTHEPYPHLFIIIDEYAEMIDDNPEYRLTLESITRVGRAQGVNLILASQQPKGVSDQMRANIKLRLCLRVEQTETSRELLRHPDAAFLPNNLPGRGYLQVGNEHLELIQVSYTGEAQPDQRTPVVQWPERAQAAAPPVAGEDAPRLFDAVVALAGELTGGQPTPKPWPSFLQDSISLESPVLDAKRNQFFTLESAVTDWVNDDTAALWPGVDWHETALRAVVGLVDNPAEAEAYPLRFDLSRSHLAVFGAAGLGKTTLLRTLLVSLTATHSPDELHAYVLDLGGRNFRSLAAFPHVGAVIYADEEAFEERTARLLERLDRLVEERQQSFSAAGADSLYDFNARHPEQTLPAVVVIIDNIAELHENHEALVESTLIPLVRRSLNVGITFVVSGNVPTNMPSKLYNLFGERVTFKQANTERYMDIVGRGAIELDDTPGRGYIRIGQRPLLFQAARPVGLLDPAGRAVRPEADELQRLADHMTAVAAAQRRTLPDPINTLPLLVSLGDLLLEAGAVPPTGVQAVLGKTGQLRPALLDLRRMGPHFAVVGPPLSGKTTALYSCLFSVADCYTPQQAMFVLIDPQRRLFDYGGAHKLGDLPHVLATISEVGQLTELVAHLKAEGEALSVQGSTRAVFILIDNFDEFSDEVGTKPSLVQDLRLLARRYGRNGLHFIISGMLDGTITDLRRQVQSSNYGIALRSAQAVEAFRGGRAPAALRDREFPPGRGYIIKSGQATLLQVASLLGSAPSNGGTGDPPDEEHQAIQALDSWVARLCARYPLPAQRAGWAARAAPPPSTAPRPRPRFTRLQELVQAFKDRDGHDPQLNARLAQLDLSNPTTEEALLAVLKDLWVAAKITPDMTRDVVEGMLPHMGEESLLKDLEDIIKSKH